VKSKIFDLLSGQQSDNNMNFVIGIDLADGTAVVETNLSEVFTSEK
jgi:hypothetical protein